jgi:hypothetical protein
MSMPDGVVTGDRSTTTWSPGTLESAAGDRISGPSGTSWVRVAVPVIGVPSIVVPRNV